MRTANRLLVMAVVLAILFASLGFISVVKAQAGEVTLKPTDDTYVDSFDANSNYGGTNYLDVQTHDWQIMTWLKFDLTSVPEGAVVDIATLQLHTFIVGETYNIGAYSCSTNTWAELSLTYANMPSYNATPMS